MADTSGFQTLIEINRENRAHAAEMAKRPPVACPYCGDVLQIRARDGVRNCPTGDFRWSGWGA
jgi:hypothetical protein